MCKEISALTLMTIVLVIYFYHIHLLMKAIQCSSSFHLDMASFHELQLHDKILFGAMEDEDTSYKPTSPSCIFVTFLSKKEFVLVDFEMDCVTKVYQDGSFEVSGFDCKNVFARTFFKDNSTVHIDMRKEESYILYSENGIYLCSDNY